MTEEERIEYANYRLGSAKKTLNAAQVLAEKLFWNSTVNRLHYAAFYAINALFVINKIHAKSHSAVKSQFSLYFIKTRRLDKKYGQLFSKLFDWRQKGDYENIFEFTSEEVLPLLKEVEDMIHVIDKEIEASN